MEKKIRSLRKSIEKDVSSIDALINAIDKKQKQEVFGSISPLFVNIKKNIEDKALHHGPDDCGVLFGLHLDRSQLDLLLGMVAVSSVLLLSRIVDKKERDGGSLPFLRSVIKFLNNIEDIYQKVATLYIKNALEDGGDNELKSNIHEIVGSIRRFSMLGTPEGVAKMVNMVLNGGSNEPK